MKTISLAGFSALLLAAQVVLAQPQRPVVSGDASKRLQGVQLSGRINQVMARPGLVFASQQLKMSGFKQGAADKDVLHISGTATLKDGSKKTIEVDLVGFEKAGEVALVGSYKFGDETYEAILKGRQGAPLDQFEELEVTRDTKSFQLRKVTGGPSPADEMLMETGFRLEPAPPSRARIRRFLQCLGSELKTSCKNQCSAATLKDCALAGGAVGAMIGGAIGFAAGGVGSVPGAVTGIVVGAVGGLVGCLGMVCGSCTAGQVLECSANLF